MMRTAVGDKEPLKCFGCAKLYPDDCNHRYVRCPRRNDTRIRAAARPHLQRLQRCGRSHATTVIDPDNWEALGFQSKEQAQMIACIADAQTSKATREAELRCLAERFKSVREARRKQHEDNAARKRAATATATQQPVPLARYNNHAALTGYPLPPIPPPGYPIPPSGPPPQQYLLVATATAAPQQLYGLTVSATATETPQKVYGSTVSASNQTAMVAAPGSAPPPANHQSQQQGQKKERVQHVYMFLILTLASTPQRQQIPHQLRLSDVLPHILLVIGAADNSVYIKALYNTGSGLNLGRKQYHDKIREARPDLVLMYADFAENDFDPLVTGGIDGQVWGPNIIACITYKLPYTYHGNPCNITVGLANEAVCNTLVGVPFMIRGRMVHHAADNVVTSGVFGVQFPCTMEKPTRTDNLLAHTEGQQAAVLATTNALKSHSQAANTAEACTVLSDGRGGEAS